jgi:hypothetical protein
MSRDRPDRPVTRPTSTNPNMKDFPMRKHSSSRSHRRFQPGLEALEDRWVPSQLAGHLHHPPHVHIVIHKVHGGTAVQNGASLSISAFNLRANTVLVEDNGLGDIGVRWNGGTEHFFRGVNDVTINVKGLTDNVTYNVTRPLTPLLHFATGIPGTELINVNLNGFNEAFKFSGAGMQDNAGLALNVQATSTGSHSIAMTESTLGAHAELVMSAHGLGSQNFIEEEVNANVGAGTLVSFSAVGSGSGLGSVDLVTAVLGDLGANAHVAMGADAGLTATKIANQYEGQVGQGASVSMDSQGSPGNDTIGNFLQLNSGSQGNVTATEEGFGGDDTLTLQTIGSTTGTKNLSVDGGTGNNTANVSPGVQVTNCQVINHI